MTAIAVRPVDTTFHASLAERGAHPCLVSLTPAERFVLGLLSDSPKSVDEMVSLGSATLGAITREELLDLAIGLEHSGCVTSNEDESPIFLLTAIGKERWKASLEQLGEQLQGECTPIVPLREAGDNRVALLLGSGIALLGVVVLLTLLSELAIRLLH